MRGVATRDAGSAWRTSVEIATSGATRWVPLFLAGSCHALATLGGRAIVCGEPKVGIAEQQASTRPIASLMFQNTVETTPRAPHRTHLDLPFACVDDDTALSPPKRRRRLYRWASRGFACVFVKYTAAASTFYRQLVRCSVYSLQRNTASLWCPAPPPCVGPLLSTRLSKFL